MVKYSVVSDLYVTFILGFEPDIEIGKVGSQDVDLGSREICIFEVDLAAEWESKLIGRFFRGLRVYDYLVCGLFVVHWFAANNAILCRIDIRFNDQCDFVDVNEPHFTIDDPEVVTFFGILVFELSEDGEAGIGGCVVDGFFGGVVIEHFHYIWFKL